MQMKKLARTLEVKSVEADGTFTGYASVFGVKDSYGDVVEKGAFLASLKSWKAKGKMPAMLWQHKRDEPIGLWLEMKEDDHGLWVKGRLLIDDDPLAKRVYAHLKAGSVGGMSIGYSLPKGGGEWDEEAQVYRLKQIKLWENSLVTFPANEEAQVETVKSEHFISDIRECELILRDAGFSKSQAKRLLAGGFDELGKRDAAQPQGEDAEKQAATMVSGFDSFAETFKV